MDSVSCTPCSFQHTGKLSAEEATAISGCTPAALLEKVMRRVGTGGKSLEAAIQTNAAKYGLDEKGDKPSTDTADAGTEGEGEALLNPALYRHLQATLADAAPAALSDDQLAALATHHAAVLDHLRAAVARAAEDAGDMEVLDATLDVARYAARVSSKDAALAAYDEVMALPKLSAGKTLDVHLEMARVASFWGDDKRMSATLAAAAKAAANGGDWDRRNRLKVYQALNCLLVRDIQGASKSLVEGIATFSCTELCEYPEFITYAIVTNLLFLKRTALKKSIIDGSEVLQVAKDIPAVLTLANTLYECEYRDYLRALVDLRPHLVADRYLQPHAGYLLRELHVLAFQQFLASYQSVTLASMATSFGVGTSFLDAQLSRFIAAGRLTAKIDKFGGVVETNRPDSKNAQYQEMVQKGDVLLNRIQKLGRVVDL